ncbi:MAG: hypothetical protein KDD55_09535 [Bdellovibrionales bacterium]|nr:hypothetical protein [Bdellovibrionales bacterium]
MRYSSIASILISIQLVSLFLRIEQYPLSAWQMYSTKNTSGRIQFFHLYSTNREGYEQRVYPGMFIPAMKDNRFLDVFWYAFDPKSQSVFDDYIRASARYYNARVPYSQQVIHWRLERWYWDTLHDLENPKHGKLIAEYDYPRETGDFG